MYQSLLIPNCFIYTSFLPQQTTLLLPGVSGSSVFPNIFLSHNAYFRFLKPYTPPLIILFKRKLKPLVRDCGQCPDNGAERCSSIRLDTIIIYFQFTFRWCYGAFGIFYPHNSTCKYIQYLKFFFIVGGYAYRLIIKFQYII